MGKRCLCPDCSARKKWEVEPVERIDKRVLYDYVDACELVKETEEDLRNHRKGQMVMDKVKGSNHEFPYQPMSFNISGIVETEVDTDGEEKLLLERIAEARKIRAQAEKLINMAPVRIQRIVRYKIFQGLKWEEVADKMGRGATGDSVRMEYRRFMEKI